MVHTLKIFLKNINLKIFTAGTCLVFIFTFILQPSLSAMHPATPPVPTAPAPHALPVTVNPGTPQISQPTPPDQSYIKFSYEFFTLLGSLLTIPDLLTQNSTNPALIKFTTLLHMIPTDTKLAYELGRKRDTRLIKELFLTMPKLAAYALCTYIDLVRFAHAQDIAQDNQEGKETHWLPIINQTAQLLIEITLRILLYTTSLQPQAAQDKTLFCCLAELADWVEIWRMLNRHDRYSGIETIINKIKSKSSEPTRKLLDLIV
jgi:hypothetical protein